MASGAPGTRATAKSSMRPPVAAGPMLRQCSGDSKDGSTVADADGGAAETGLRLAIRAAENRTARIGRLSYDPSDMRTGTIARVAVVFSIGLLTRPASAADDNACDRLRNLKLPNASITSAESVAPGAFTAPSTP